MVSVGNFQSPSLMKNNKEIGKRLRFTADDDLILLRECISLNPIEDVDQWEILQKNVEQATGKCFKVRTLKDHLFLLLEVWIEKDVKTQKKSGTEEIYSERDVLLQEIKDLCEKAKVNPYKKRKIISKEKKIADLGRQTREVFAEQHYSENINANVCVTNTENEHNYFSLNEAILSPNDLLPGEEPIIIEIGSSIENLNEKEEEITDESSNKSKENKVPKKRILGPSRVKNNRSSLLRRSALDYLQNKEEKDRKIKEKELELQERKIQLEEKKMKMEEENHRRQMLDQNERIIMEKERFKLELLERNQQAKIIEHQQQLIGTLLEKLKGSETLQV